jgi:hypothetical protein
MPRYYFRLEPGIARDTEGDELPNDEAARRVAEDVAGDLTKNRPPTYLGTLVVADITGAVVGEIELRGKAA